MAEALTIYDEDHVELTKLETALGLLWERAESADPERQLTRALTLNIIAVTDRAGAVAIHEAVAALPACHPCRAFVVVIESQTTPLHARLTLHTSQQRRARQTVFERIELTGDPTELERVTSLVLPHLINDIPVCVYWATALPEADAHLRRLARLADRIVVNSCRLTDPERDLLRLAEACGGAPCTDLGALRLRPWRHSLAEAFESFAWQREVPTRVRIERGPAATTAVTSLTPWLVDRLDAEVEHVEVPDSSPEPTRLTLQHGPVKVDVIRDNATNRLRVDVTRGDFCLIPTFTPRSRATEGELLRMAVDL